MTTLAIMATYEKKRLKCYGTVAAGEHVAVTVTDGAQWIGEGKALRLRVLFGPDTVGVFPFADGDAWTTTGTQNADAYCELNLNTLQAEKYLKHGGTCLWILDDVENHTLYATGEFDVLPWPKRRGIDEPIDLDGYPLLLDEIKDLKEAFEEYQRTVAQMLATKQNTIFDLATIRSGAAAGATAVQPAQIARFVDDAEYKAQYGEQNKPAILFKHGTNVIVALDATPFVRDGMVSDVKIVGGNLVITFNTDSGKQPIEIPLTDIFDPDNYYDKTAVDALLAPKADKATTYTKPETGIPKIDLAEGIQASLDKADTSPIVLDVAHHSRITVGDVEFEVVLYWNSGARDRFFMAAQRVGTWLTQSGEWQSSAEAYTHTWESGGVTYTATRAAGNYFTPVYINGVESSLNNIASRCAGQDLGTTAQAFYDTLNAYFATCDGDGNRISDTYARKASPGHAGNLAALDAQGNPTNSLIPAANVAQKSNIPYDLGTPIVINTASPGTVEGETVYYGAATLANRTANIVQVTAATALDELRITFPAATSGKVRDFGLRVEIGTGSAALAAPALVPIAPTGETIKIENNAKEIPALADGTATAKGVTLLYFSENAPGVFVVKGEQVEEVA